MHTAVFNPVAGRFVWKEYRALRGLWFAVLILGLFVQWLSGVVLPGHVDFATMFFSIALGAAALYAAGAAATTFAVEQEEETYAFIAGLPTTWLPVYAGKLAFATASALALAAALALSGWITCGFDTPGGRDFPMGLGLFGVPIIEALAWGTLFSLLVKRPLLAAILTLVVGTIVVQLTASAMSSQAAPLADPGNYIKALPLRIVVVVVVFAVATMIARLWFATPKSLSADPMRVTVDDMRTPSWAISAGATVSGAFAGRHRQLNHLLWQTLRQSWHLLLAIPMLAVLLCESIFLIAATANAMPSNYIELSQFTPFTFAFAAAALCASAVFSVDQRGSKYRFLAEHAASPRLVWFARLSIWLLPALLAVVVLSATSYVVSWEQLSNSASRIRSINRLNSYWEVPYLGSEISSAQRLLHGFGYALWGLGTGFALGQACSLFFRQAIIAGFVAATMTIPLLVWGLLIWVWELSPTVFLLPIAVGLFAATWLRVPDWIIDRNRPSSWLKVATALVLPLLLVAWRLPAARLAVVPAVSATTLDRIAWSQGLEISPAQEAQVVARQIDIPAVVADWAAKFESELTPAEWETAEQLIRLSERIDAPERPKTNDAKPELTPADWNEYNRELVALNPEIIEEAVKLSGKKYRFSPFVQIGPQGEKVAITHLDDLVDLLSHAGDVALEGDKLDAALEYYLSALTLWDRLSVGQPNDFLPSEWYRRQHQQKLVTWANAPGQTRERIGTAIDAINAIYPDVEIPRPAADLSDYITNLSPPATLMADYVLLRDIILGNTDSRVLTPNTGPFEYAALLVSQLPFERERALRLLDRITFDQVIQCDTFTRLINQRALQALGAAERAEKGESGVRTLGSTLRYRFLDADGYGVDDPYFDRSRYSALRSSLLLRMELQRAKPFIQWLQYVVDRQVSGWGLRQQLALVAYRHDHGNYPDSLAKLVPRYLPFVPIDPYCGQPFEYRSQGLPLEFRDRWTIDPHTPFLWSVGLRNAQLRINTVYDAVDPTADPADDTNEHRRDVYRFELEPSLWNGGGPLVFPLPK